MDSIKYINNKLNYPVKTMKDKFIERLEAHPTLKARFESILARVGCISEASYTLSYSNIRCLKTHGV